MTVFGRDLFDIAWDRPVTTQASESDLDDAVEVCLGLFESDDWSDVVELSHEHVSRILRKRPEQTLPREQALLAIVATAEARLAMVDGLSALASDWFFTGLARCSAENSPPLNMPLGQMYILAAAAIIAGERILSVEPAQICTGLSDQAFGDLARAYVRLSVFGERRRSEATAQAPSLFGHIADYLWDRYGPRGKRRGGVDVVDLAYERFSSSLRMIRDSHQELLRIQDVPLLRDGANRLLRQLGQCEDCFLSSEQHDVEHMRGILGRGITRLAEAYRISDPVSKREAFSLFATSASNELSYFSRSGLFAQTICLPVVEHLQTLCAREIEFARSSLTPSVVLKQSKKRYPLDQTGESIRLQLEIANQGNGIAQRCEVTLDPPDTGISFDKPMPIHVETIPPGRTATFECPISLSRSAETVAFPVRISYCDIFGGTHTISDTLVVERQRAEPDWDELMRSAPYGLEPVSSLQRLRGRGAILSGLRLNTAIGTSSVIWGQKRVGKTSIATVFAQEVVKDTGLLQTFVRRGNIAPYGEGQIARALAQRIALAAPDLGLDVPDEAWFGPHLARLTDWLNVARQRGLSKRILIVIDEFDEINPSLYLGQRGANFFATLRSLSEEGIVWIFVGSERMPNIFMRHHTTLNKIEVFEVDCINDPGDIQDIVVTPVEGALEWDPDAVDLIRQLTAGNPYYINLLCQRVLRNMYHARRTFVDRADVIAAADSVTRAADTHHWGTSGRTMPRSIMTYD